MRVQLRISTSSDTSSLLRTKLLSTCYLPVVTSDIFALFRRVSCLAAEKARKQNGGENVFISGRGGEFLHYHRIMWPPVVHRGHRLGQEGNWDGGGWPIFCDEDQILVSGGGRFDSKTLHCVSYLWIRWASVWEFFCCRRWLAIFPDFYFVA